MVGGVEAGRGVWGHDEGRMWSRGVEGVPEMRPAVVMEGARRAASGECITMGEERGCYQLRRV